MSAPTNHEASEVLAKTISRSSNTAAPTTTADASDAAPTRSPTASVKGKTDSSSSATEEGITRPSTDSASVSKHADADAQRDLEKGHHSHAENGSGNGVPGAGSDATKQKQEEVDANNSAGADPNIIDFAPDDPAMALHWPRPKKWLIISVLSFLTFVTPLASSMFAPGVPQVMQDFRSTSSTLGSFVVSVYVLGYAAGPIVIAPLSELYGRAYLYTATNVMFVVFTVACAVAQNMAQLTVFRFFEGLAGSAVLTMGGGTIADLFVQEERGRAMAIWSSGPLLGPVVGPIAGGFLSKAEGWRWVFWLITIAGGVATAICFIVYKETYAPTILQRRVNRLRKETGNPHLRSALDSGLSPGSAFLTAIVRPSKMLLFSPIVLGLSVYNAVVYGYLYLLFTTISLVFERSYGFDSGVVGLTFLGIGIGMLLGLVIFGLASDRHLKKKAAQTGEKKPEYRLPPMVPAAFLIPVGLFIYGWSAEKRVHWFVPIFGTAWLGFGVIATFLAIQTYLVDAFTMHAASAIAANTILRSLLGALLPLAGPDMYAALGLGWGNSLLGFIGIAFIPLPFFFAKYGERIRTNPRFQVKL